MKIGVIFEGKLTVEQENILAYSQHVFGSEVDLVYSQYNYTTQSRYHCACYLLQKDVSAVLSYSTSNFITWEAEFFSEVNIPIISFSATNPFLRTANRKYLIRFATSDKIGGEAVFSIIKSFQWTSFSILASSDDYGLNGISELVQLAMSDKTLDLKTIQYFEHSPDYKLGNVGKQLKLIRDTLSSVVVIHCDSRYGPNILQQAGKLGLLDIGFVWIVTSGFISSLNLSETSSFQYRGLISVVPNVNLSLSYASWERGYKSTMNSTMTTLSDLLAYDAISYLIYIIKNTGLSFPAENRSCISAGKLQNGEQFLEAIISGNFDALTGPMTFDNLGMIKRHTYDITNYKRYHFETVGVWNSLDNFYINKSGMRFLGGGVTVPISHVNTLSGKHLKIGVVLDEGLFRRKPKCTDSTLPNCWEGIFIDINNRLAHELNFTYQLKEPEDRQIGKFDERLKRFTGLIYGLQQHKFDLVSMDLTVNVERAEVMDFLYTMYQSPVKGYFIYKGDVANAAFFTKPFGKFVWISIPLVILSIGIIITVIDLVSPVRHMYDKKRGRKPARALHEVFRNVFLVACGFVGREGGDAIPRSPAARFLLIFWWFFATIMIAIYTASLTAFITVERKSNINNLRDLAQQTEYRWAFRGASSIHTALEKSTANPTIVKNGLSMDNKDNIESLVQYSKFVYITEDFAAHTQLHKSWCDLTSFYTNLPISSLTYGVPKNAHYRDLLSIKLLEYQESGYLKDIYDKYVENETDCHQLDMTSTPQLESFSLHVIYGMFLMVLVAIITSVLLLILEKVCVRWMN